LDEESENEKNLEEMVEEEQAEDDDSELHSIVR